MVIVSPKLTLKGSSREAKNGLETVSSNSRDNPRPLSSERENASATHVVMVSGTVEFSLATPLSLHIDRNFPNGLNLILIGFYHAR